VVSVLVAPLGDGSGGGTFRLVLDGTGGGTRVRGCGGMGGLGRKLFRADPLLSGGGGGLRLCCFVKLVFAGPGELSTTLFELASTTPPLLLDFSQFLRRASFLASSSFMFSLAAIFHHTTNPIHKRSTTKRFHIMPYHDTILTIPTRPTPSYWFSFCHCCNLSF